MQIKLKKNYKTQLIMLIVKKWSKVDMILRWNQILKLRWIYIVEVINILILDLENRLYSKLDQDNNQDKKISYIWFNF